MQDVEQLDKKAEEITLAPDVLTNLKFQAVGEYFCNAESFPCDLDDQYEAGAKMYEYLMGLEVDDMTWQEVFDLISEEKDGFEPVVYSPYSDINFVDVITLVYDHYHALKTFFLRNYIMQVESKKD